MADSSIAEQTPSSHRNTSINTNSQCNFKTPTCFWVQRLSGTAQSACANCHALQTHVIYHMKYSLKLADHNDE